MTNWFALDCCGSRNGLVRIQMAWAVEESVGLFQQTEKRQFNI